MEPLMKPQQVVW